VRFEIAIKGGKRGTRYSVVKGGAAEKAGTDLGDLLREISPGIRR
jgi:hypothetical protein